MEDVFEIVIDIDKFFSGKVITDAIEKAIYMGIDEGKVELAQRIKGKVIENYQAEGLGDSTLVNSIIATHDSDGIKVYSTSDHVAFVEYGTGIVGKEGTQHPKANEVGWQPDITKHGHDGWQYIGKDGKLHWTKGMVARPVMYKTWRWTASSTNQIVQKNVNRRLKEVTSKIGNSKSR